MDRTLRPAGKDGFHVYMAGEKIGRVCYSNFYGRWEAIHRSWKPGDTDLHYSKEQAAEAVISKEETLR